MTERKVVGIHGFQPLENHNAKPLPAVITSLRELFRNQLKTSLCKLFDNADDSLFALADKADTSGEQALYFDAMRELRLQKKYIANHCLKDIVSAFNEVNQFQYESLKTGNDELLEWSLLDNDDLELRVAVDAMASRVRSESGTQLRDLNERLLSLVELDAELVELLPISAKRICDAFTLSCEELEVGLKEKLIVLKLFEKYVLSDYPELYSKANELLIEHDILPNLSRRARLSARSKISNTTKQNSQIEIKTKTLHPKKSNDDYIVPLLGSEDFVESQCGSQFEELRSLLHVNDESLSKPVQSSSNVVYIEPSNIVEMLSEEQCRAVNPSINNTASVIDFNQLVNTRLQSGNHKLNQIDTDTINLVSMLFEFILEDRQLQPEMKALISRLQIPILKVAILDRSFFDRGGHPARRLLNKIASAAIGWNPMEEGRKDPLKEKLSTVINSIVDGFQSDVSLFETLLKEFSLFVDRENKRGNLVEQRTKDSETGKAITEQANQHVFECIEIVIEDFKNQANALPEEISVFFRDGWSRVMVLSLLKNGEDSGEFKSSVSLLTSLSKTVCPDRKVFDARGKLLAQIPKVMRDLKAGLADASFSNDEIMSICSFVEKHQIEALNSLQTYEEFAKSAMDDEAVADLIADTLDIESDFQNFVADTKPSVVEEYSALTEKNSACEENQEDNSEGAAGFKNETISTVVNPITDIQSETHSTSSFTPADKVNFKEPVLGNARSNISPHLEAFISQVERYSVGTWFEIDTDGKSERCKLAALIKSIDKYIFVNRSGVKVAEHSKEALAILVKDGKVQVLNDGLLFDRALESVIGSLRS